jgi:hypothetical protein
MSELPPEIWQSIAEYLPTATTAKYMGVNRVFLNLALDHLYKELDAISFTQKSIQRLELLRLEHLLHRYPYFDMADKNDRDTRYASLVRKVSFDLDAYLDSDKRKSDERLSSTKSSTWRFMDGFRTPQPPLPQPYEPEGLCALLVEILPLLPSVRALSVTQHSHHTDWDVSSVPFIPIAWASFSSTLQEINLSVTVPAFSKCISNETPLPSVTKMDIYLLPPPLDDTGIYLDHVATFINRFQETLQHIGIHSRPEYDISSVFRDLGTFTHLTAVSMFGKIHVEEPLRFVQRHSHVIKKVTDLGPRLAGLSTLQLQTLESLTLVALSFPNVASGSNWTGRSPFYSSIKGTLRRLTIFGPLLPNKIQELLDAITEGGGSCALEDLSFDTRSLTVEIVPMISTRVPRLKSLSIRLHDVHDQDSTVSFITPSDSFPFDMVCLQLCIHVLTF